MVFYSFSFSLLYFTSTCMLKLALALLGSLEIKSYTIKFLCDKNFFSSAPLPYFTAPYVLTHHYILPLHTPNKGKAISYYLHHGSCPDMGTGCQKEKTPTVLTNGVRSRLGAICHSATSTNLLLSLFSIHPSSFQV